MRVGLAVILSGWDIGSAVLATCTAQPVARLSSTCRTARICYTSHSAGAKSKEAGCRNAPPGHYAPTDGQAQALPCEKGNVQPLEGQSSCTECPLEGGAVAEGTGGTRCVPW